MGVGRFSEIVRSAVTFFFFSALAVGFFALLCQVLALQMMIPLIDMIDIETKGSQIGCSEQFCTSVHDVPRGRTAAFKNKAKNKAR